MKNYKNILAILVLSIALYSVNASATTNNSETATFETLAEDGPGDQGNDVEQRDNDED